MAYKYFEDITNFIFVENEPQEADIIFIPGGTYPEPSESAAKLWQKGYAQYVMPSGKFSVLKGYFPGPHSKRDIYSREYKTEWEFMQDVLVINGVNPMVILPEDNATNTYENAIYSRRAADRLGLRIKNAIICCKAFHARRCLMYYETLFPKTQFYICPSETDNINKHNWFMGEKGIETVLGELRRCGGQFVEILKEQLNII